jgi:hypothetical protein
MARLAEIIGPAPSEMDTNTFLRRLAKERDRVRDSLSAMRQQATAPKRSTKATKRKPAVAKRIKAIEASGHSLSEIEKLMQAALAKKEEQNADTSSQD